jgi:hypothetical protein
MFEGRRLDRYQIRIQRTSEGPVGGSSNLVADPIPDSLSKVPVQSGGRRWLERVKPAQGSQHRFLHEVVGVGQIARPVRQSSSSPPCESRDIALKECVQRIAIALLRQAKERQ